MSYIYLFIFVFLSNISCFLDNSFQNINNINYSTPVSDMYAYLRILFECPEKFSNESAPIKGSLITKCMINETIGNEKHLIDLIKALAESNMIYSMIIEGYIKPNDESGIVLKIVNYLKDDINNGSVLTDMLYLCLNQTDSSGNHLLNYIYNIVDELQNNESFSQHVLKNISFIFNNFDTIEVYNYMKNNSPDFIIDLVETFLENTINVKATYEIIKNKSYEIDKSGDLHHQIIFLIFDVMINFMYEDKAIRLLGDFLYNHMNAIELFKTLLLNKRFQKIVKDYFNFQDNIIDTIINSLFEGGKVYDVFFELFSIRELIKDGAELILNIKNGTYIEKYLPTYLKNISNNDSTLINRILEGVMIITKKLNSDTVFLDRAYSALQSTVLDYLYKRNVTEFNISNECRELFKQTFFNESSDWNQILLFYVKKFVFDSPRNKGDFLDFDNCLDIANDSAIQNTLNNKTINYKNILIEPAFVIGILDNKEEKKNNKNSTFYENYYYISNLCLPFGYRNNTEMCNQSDYNEILHFLNTFFTNVSNINFTALVMNKSNVELKSSDILIGLFSILILLIPIIIKLFLIISKCIVNKKNKKIAEINKLISNNKNNKQVNKNELYKGKEYIISNKKEIPKWQKLLNEYFAFIKNGNELFNFDLNSTDFNNVNGLTYIKGLIGFSIILTVFGLTFTILINLPMKEYGTWHFQKSIKSFLFFVLFIGYRYSPRVLFSCSGYTLIYKYLCFIKQEKGFYLLKFIFLQSYKYLLLYFILIIYRFSAHEIIYLFRQLKRPSWKVYDYYLSNENFLTKSLTLLFSFSSSDNDYTEKQNLIYNFYMPINEIFFFLFGTILISIGYKYKLRLDYIIIGIILFCFGLKVILFSAYFYNVREMYTTTDYYLFDFGTQFVNPLYNLSYFLIGMYFGLINYSIQKGIIDIYEDNNYKKYIPLKDSQFDNEKEESHSDINTNLLNNNNNDNKNISLSKNDDIKEVIKENVEDNINKIEINNEINKDNINKTKEYNEQIKDMPFLISPIKFLKFNKERKDSLYYYIIIILALFIMLFLAISKTIFSYILSDLNENSENKEYMKELSLEKTISNDFLNILYLFDVEIIVFISHWIIFILFFKETEVVRKFFNSIYWSFFVKSYYSFILVSVPVILIIFYDSESVIKIHTYNFFLFSFINLIVIFVFVVIFYSIYDLPLKKIFKYCLKKDEIIEEDDDNEEEEEEEENEEDLGLEEEYEEEEMKSLKN